MKDFPINNERSLPRPLSPNPPGARKNSLLFSTKFFDNIEFDIVAKPQLKGNRRRIMNSPDSLLSPRLDIVFIKLFTEDTELLINLINSVLELPEDRRILSVEVRTPILLPQAVTKKFNILDIRAEDNSGNQYDIEMQVKKFEAYPKRALYYVCRLYVGEMKSGEDYDALIQEGYNGLHFGLLFKSAWEFNTK
ncbi:MAG: Rpn family recombination-promoting nuclease/putative transposase [Desulfobacterales bacterium]|nr:Rpn family recombination-promoting nuclease/putative transposase [Desulfobacterales bacterium]